MTDKLHFIPNMEFSKLAGDDQIERTMQALEANNIHAVLAENGAEAKRMFFELLPEGAEIFLGASVTLEKLGIKDEIEKSGRYDALRPKMFAMNRETPGREIRKLGGTPDYAAGSVHAVTESGTVMMASLTGSQLRAYAFPGAGKVIWVVGAQKLYRDLEEGLRRIQEYCYPLEDAHLRGLIKMGTSINKILIVKRELRPIQHQHDHCERTGGLLALCACCSDMKTSTQRHWNGTRKKRTCADFLIQIRLKKHFFALFRLS